MAQRSLLDDGDFGSIGKKGGAGGGGSNMDKAQMIKIGVIVLCFLGAGVAIAWNLGLFDGGPPRQKLTAEQEQQLQEEFEKQQKENERLLSLPGYESGDA